MRRFVLRRLAHSALVVFGVTLVVFVATRLLGDPVAVMLPLDAPEAQRQALTRTARGSTSPSPSSSRSSSVGCLRLDLGRSLWQDRPALGIIIERLPLTLLLVGTAVLLAVAAGLPLGVVAALRPGRAADRVTTVISLAALSVPQFWLGLLLIVLFSVVWRLLPSSGSDGPASLVLPALTLALPSAGRIAMVVRSTMMTELEHSYIRFAEAKGLRRARIVAVHAGRNAAVPVLTLVSWELIRMLAGYAVVVETVFAWPGLGLLALQSIERQDLVLLQANVMVVAVMVVVLTFATDVAYKAIDPRLEFG